MSRVNESKKIIILTSVVVGIVLNITLSWLCSKFATDSQISPPEGAAKLNLIDQFMHMLVHHKQVLFTSSLIVAIVVGLSVTLALNGVRVVCEHSATQG